ncbi:FAD dependent oxidoreductase [Aspergillus cavernicola]|uniref:FAD dependent oxidoreductase n=1 Tax=Aspergillus cavernicola TaxID=176166 RepID=A0ABR4IPI8_9EURO
MSPNCLQKTMSDMASQHTSHIVIIGGGIVGSALAYFLSTSEDGKKVTAIDRSFSRLNGSTGYAPGFVGQFNESEVLTRLAIDSVEEYSKVPEGFDHVGGLEIATSNAGVENLKMRLASAKERGLEAEMISSQQAMQMAPDLVKDDNILALHFPGDGTANPSTITAFFQSEARARGVHFLEGDVTGIRRVDDRVNGVMTSAGFVQAETVVLATGIWAKNLCDFDLPVPVIPVAHPYMYGEHHKPKTYKSPFVRFPEHHVYARDHGQFFGLGSYDHKPLAENPEDTALGNWKEDFDATLDRALQLIPANTNLVPREKFNGIFSVTPDNMPLVGEIPNVKGLYMAAAVWVTHAAGCAKFLTRMLKGERVDVTMQKALDPTRFQGRDMKSLERVSLHCYNSIYSTHERS